MDTKRMGGVEAKCAHVHRRHTSLGMVDVSRLFENLAMASQDKRPMVTGIRLDRELPSMYQ
jgi:hypothetical protein